MATDDDTLTRRPSPSDILRELRENPAGRRNPPPEQPTPATPPEAAEEFGPESYDPRRKDYKAFGGAGKRTLPSLVFVMKDRSERAVSYAHLDSHYPGGCEFIPSAPGKGNLIRLRFAGASVIFTVEIEGRNLHRCWELIMGHLTPWVAAYPADIDTLAADEPVIKSIEFKPEK